MIHFNAMTFLPSGVEPLEMDFIFRFLLRMIFVIPGAIFRWVFFGCRKPLVEYIDSNSYMNSGIGLLAMGVIILIVTYFLSN